MQQISKKSNFNHGFTIVELPTSLKLPTSQMLCRTNHRTSLVKSGFTIVELLVVIVVIGILAAITIVSYTGISQRAKVAALQSDLSNASQQLKIFQATEASGNYPIANTCPTPGTTEICLKASNGNAYTYTPSNGTNPKTFALKAVNETITYHISENSSPFTLTSTDWITIGTQVWAKANLNVGTMVPGTLGQPNTTNQTNNAILEKYCYLNDTTNCTTYGGLYQWDEAMQYVTTNGAQGICPVGSHIPTDAEWKTLEMSLSGMLQATADTIGWRGTDEGTKLKSGGSSGLNILSAGGYRNPDGSFNDLPSFARLWSGSESGTTAWNRYLYLGYATVNRDAYGKAFGFSVRCMGN